MSEILARIRVRETAGIRRFLYPLTTYVMLPRGINTNSLSLATEQGMAVPLQVTCQNSEQFRVDFAVSLAPLQEDMELLLTEGGTQVAVPDPLQLTQEDEGTLRSVQERFQLTLGKMGEINDVIYDGVPHLYDKSLSQLHAAVLNRTDPDDKNYIRGLIPAEQAENLPFNVVDVHTGGGPLAAWSRTSGIYADGCHAEITSEITACKSWAKINYRLEQPHPGEKFYSYLPLGGDFALGNPTRTIFDTGISGIYGQANYWGAFLHWLAPIAGGDTIRWEVGRQYVYENGQNLSPTDYVGTTSEQDFHLQRWFHIADGNKAIAVAITKMPATWRELKIDLRKTIKVELILAEDAAGPMEFGVCYHFLNDVPAIAAATNPQSILLPPLVEVLPV